MIFVGIVIAAVLMVISVINRKLRPYALLGLLLLLALVAAAIHLTSDEQDQCLDAGGAWSQERGLCAFR